MRVNSLFPGMNQKKGRIILNDFSGLHNYLKKLIKKPPSSKKRSSIRFGKKNKGNIRKTQSVIIREKRVKYGLEKYKDPNLKTVINKERIKNVNGKKIKEVKFKTVKRNKIKASNKLPLVGKKQRQKKLSNATNGRLSALALLGTELQVRPGQARQAGQGDIVFGVLVAARRQSQGLEPDPQEPGSQAPVEFRRVRGQAQAEGQLAPDRQLRDQLQCPEQPGTGE